MQREIEALLKAYVEDSGREARLIQNVLTALAVGAAARQRMIADIQAAVGVDTVEPTQAQAFKDVELLNTASSPILKSVPRIVTDDVALAISHLRAARDAAVVH